MARAPKNSYGQSRYTDQLLQTALTPTTTSGTLGFTVGTNLNVSTLTVTSISAGSVFTPNFIVGDLRTETLNVGCQSFQGTYTCNVSSTIIGVRAVGNANARGTFTNNVIVGAEAGLNLCNTDFSVYMGAGAGTFGQGQSNTVVGYGAAVGIAGIPVTRGNVIIGAGAGISNSGNSNVFLGVNAGADLSTNSNLLIVNTRATSSNALLYGRFDTGQLGINCIPGLNIALHVSGGSMRVERNLIVDGDIVSSSLSGDINASSISGVATKLRGSGNGIFGGVGLSGGVSIFNTNANLVGLIEGSNGNGVITLCNAARTTKITIDGSSSSIIGDTAVFSNGIVARRSTFGATSSYLPDFMCNASGSAIYQASYAGAQFSNSAGVTFSISSVSGGIVNLSGSSNSIGGVILNNTAITASGGITVGASTVGAVYIGNGINANNFEITSGSGRFFNNATTSNTIGGVLLSNCNVVATGSISGGYSACNVIGGVTLQNGSIIGNIQGGAGSSIDGNSINNTTIPGGKLSNGTITATQIAANTIVSSNLASNLTLGGTTTAVISNDPSSSNNIGGFQLYGSTINGVTIASTDICAGTISGNYVYGTNFRGNGSNITNIAASNITTGIIDAARLPTMTTFISGNGEYGGVLLSNKGVKVEGLAIFTASGMSILDKTNSNNRIIAGDPGGIGSYDITTYTSAGVKTSTITSATGNFSNLSNSSNDIGGVTLNNGQITISFGSISSATPGSGTAFKNITINTPGLYFVGVTNTSYYPGISAIILKTTTTLIGGNAYYLSNSYTNPVCLIRASNSNTLECSSYQLGVVFTVTIYQICLI